MIYDYKCSKCGELLSVERSIHDDPKDPTCFVCHISMSRVYDAPVITFKGSGFYSNGG